MTYYGRWRFAACRDQLLLPSPLLPVVRLTRIVAGLSPRRTCRIPRYYLGRRGRPACLRTPHAHAHTYCPARIPCRCILLACHYSPSAYMGSALVMRRVLRGAFIPAPFPCASLYQRAFTHLSNQRGRAGKHQRPRGAARAGRRDRRWKAASGSEGNRARAKDRGRDGGKARAALAYQRPSMDNQKMTLVRRRAARLLRKKKKKKKKKNINHHHRIVAAMKA